MKYVSQHYTRVNNYFIQGQDVDRSITLQYYNQTIKVVPVLNDKLEREKKFLNKYEEITKKLHQVVDFTRSES